jgi:hypothetical protein
MIGTLGWTPRVSKKKTKILFLRNWSSCFHPVDKNGKMWHRLANLLEITMFKLILLVLPTVGKSCPTI